ncbi:hypothetical protein HK101_001447 [Irineochytrium annulatum]|nr:hypothetical protein HK101_001447 [Irineochytrium annulatum]
MLECRRVHGAPVRRVDPASLLAWLGRLDRVDVTDVDVAWATALTERFRQGRRPRVLVVPTTGPGVGIMDVATRALAIWATGDLNEDVADFLRGIRIGAGVTAVGFNNIGGDGNVGALMKFLGTHGEKLRTLELNRVYVRSGVSLEGADAVKSLTGLSADSRGGDRTLLSKLVAASQSTLVDLRLLMAGGGNIRLCALPRLQSLELALKQESSIKGGIAQALRSMGMLTQLCVTVCEREALLDVMKSVDEMSMLRELSVQYDGANLNEGVENSIPEMRLRIRTLRKLALKSVLGYQVRKFRGRRLPLINMHLGIVDWEAVASNGLPLVEELDVELETIKLTRYGRGGESFTPILYTALRDPSKTPALAYANLKVEHYGVPNAILLSGGGSSFSQEALSRLGDI